MMMTSTLSRYFGLTFLRAVIAVFLGVFVLVTLIDYIELLRHSASEKNVSAWLVARTSLYRVPQLTERIMPFAILIGAMSSFLAMSRRNELVVARSAGMSAWQFIMPSLAVAIVLGILATTIYNPLAAVLNEQSKRLELQISRRAAAVRPAIDQFGILDPAKRVPMASPSCMPSPAANRRLQLGGVTAFTFDAQGIYQERIEARAATTLAEGYWRFEDARVFGGEGPPTERNDLRSQDQPLGPRRVRESFATPESVPFWDLPSYIDTAERSGLGAAGYRLQYQKLIARPFLLAAMVMPGRRRQPQIFSFGGVQKMVMSGILSGFLLYVLQKVTEDLSKANSMPALAAAWLPVLVGALTGFVALLYQEDG